MGTSYRLRRGDAANAHDPQLEIRDVDAVVFVHICQQVLRSGSKKRAFSNFTELPKAVSRRKSKLFGNQKSCSTRLVCTAFRSRGFCVTIRNIASPSQTKSTVIENQPNLAPP